MEDFELFKETFTKYQEMFGLTGYQIYFNYKPLEKTFAEISVNQNNMVATVYLNSQLPKKDKLHKNIKLDAKHEVIHLLLNKLEHMAYARYVTEVEIYEATEELVNKLVKLW